MPTFGEITDLIKNVGVPAGALFFILWRLEARLVELVKAVQAAPVCATPDQVAAAVAEGTDKVIREVDHNTRGVLANFDVRRP